MEQLDLSKIKNVHFVGIGGIGISAIARMMLFYGKNVTGQDIQDSEIVQQLSKAGADIFIGQSFEKIPEDTDLIIYTIAIENYDKELFEKLKEQKIPIRSYPQMLGIVTEGKKTIAVSGTHGKTTVTAMIAKILIDAGFDPSVIVGSLLKEHKSNLVIGKSEIFVVEACEYERSFLNIKPKILVITNIESDHLDYYKDIKDIESAFSEMASHAENFIICNLKDPSTINILKNKYKAEIVDYTKYLDKVPKLLVPGIHNQMNAAVALALADCLGILESDSKKIIAEFSGTWRRLEKIGETKEGTIIYDDYAHHPTEIKASIEALRELYPDGDKKITIVFQPHLYSRTKALFGDFAKSFKGVDNIIILPVFFAREHLDSSVSSDKLAVAVCKEGDNAQAFPDFKSAEDYLKSLNFGPKDVFVTMGAGEAYKIANQVFKFS